MDCIDWLMRLSTSLSVVAHVAVPQSYGDGWVHTVAARICPPNQPRAGGDRFGNYGLGPLRSMPHPALCHWYLHN